MQGNIEFNNFCSVCEYLLCNLEAEFKHAQEVTWEYQNLRELQQSAADGCHLCRLVHGCFNEDTLEELQKELLLLPYHGNHPLGLRAKIDDEHHISLKVKPPEALEQSPIAEFDFSSELTQLLEDMPALRVVDSTNGLHAFKDSLTLAKPALKAEQGRIIVSTPVFDSTVNSDSFKTIQEWIRLCDTGHPECKKTMQSAKRRLPTRLLDLKREDVFLVDTEFLPLSTRYITLSHRWTPTTVERLLESNKESYYNKIPMDELSETFTDTIFMTRALGIRYLWIDSLCIIQDSTEDWETQSRSMCDVYTNSQLNIAAVAASNGTGGLNHYRDPLQVVPCTIRAAGKDGGFKELLVYRSYSWQDYVDSPELNERGWVVQERLLAPRAVNFAADQVYWECPSLRASECFPLGLLDTGVDYISGKNVKTLLKGHQEGENDRLEEFTEVWSDILCMYTRGELTKESDRPWAISGIVERLAQGFGLDKDSDYLVGLWKPYLEVQLLWHAEMNNNSRKADAVPSWSWLSFGGSVEYHDYTSEELPLISLLEASSSANRTHQPFIRLRGSLCNIISLLPGEHLRDTESDICETEAFQKMCKGCDFDQKKDRPSNRQLVESTFVLLARKPRKLGLPGGRLVVLLLQLTGEKRGQYRRVGIAMFPEHDRNKAFEYEACNECCESGGVVSGSTLGYRCMSVTLPEQCFSAYEEGKGYIIELV